VLWKSAKDSEPEDAKWDSDFGRGRPGWHIECSAMSCELLGKHFDIHGGGLDLQFPHHENEIAQSEGASGSKFVNVWMHNGFLNIDNVKMSKSLGNFFTIRDVLQRYDGETIRFFMLRTQYRSPFNFSDVNLDDARQSLRRLYTALASIDLPEVADEAIDWADPHAGAFRAAMNEDFNTPGALAVLFDLAAEVNRGRSIASARLLRALGGTLGVLQNSPKAHLQAVSGPASGQLSDERIAELIEERQLAKSARDFARADQIRKELADHSILLQDSPQGSSWVRA
jgi:cysteinyl-tRNA synthetase